MELIFILTYQCNYRCHYCGIRKRGERMSDATLGRALDFLSGAGIAFGKVKFFGGEPLLEKAHIRRAVVDFPASAGTPGFYVTTNATLADADFMAFARERGMKVTFSADGDAAATDANRVAVGGGGNAAQVLETLRREADFVRVNQVVGPATAPRFFANFLHLYGLGVRRFNFLPEYFRPWTKAGLAALAAGFGEILRHRRAGNDFMCVNLENASEIPFFNLGLVVDADGALYGTNLVLDAAFEKAKPRLLVGDVTSGLVPGFGTPDFSRAYCALVQSEIAAAYPPAVLASTRRADEVLNAFVAAFRSA